MNNSLPEKHQCKKTFGSNQDGYKKYAYHYLNNNHEPPKPYVHNNEFNWDHNRGGNEIKNGLSNGNDNFVDSLDKIKLDFIGMTNNLKNKSVKQTRDRPNYNLSTEDIEGCRPKSKLKFTRDKEVD